LGQVHAPPTRLRELVGGWWTPRGTLTKPSGWGFDRDYVAACRILSLGLGRPEVTPVEMGPSTLHPGFRCDRGASPVIEAGSPMRKLGVVHNEDHYKCPGFPTKVASITIMIELESAYSYQR